MEETLISFETAKLAKEKGFNEYCVMAYFKNDKISLSHCYSLQDDECRAEDEKYAPTQSLLAKWLREVHNIDIEIMRDISVKWSNIYYNCIIIKDNKYNYISNNSGGNPTTYEEALEQALFNALKLINNESKTS